MKSPMPTTTPPAPQSSASAVPPPAKATGLWTFLRPYLRKYRGLIILALFLNGFHGFAITFQNLVPRYLIDDILLAKGLTTHERYVRLAWLCGEYLAATIVWRMLVWHIGYRIFTYVREKVVFALRADFFKHVNHLCLRFHLKHHSGELFNYLFGSPLASIQNYFQQFTFGVPGAVCILGSTLIWIGGWDWMLTSILVLLVTSNVVLMQYIRPRIQLLQADFQATESNVSGYVADLLRGSRDVKLYAMEAKVAEDFEERVVKISQQAYRRDVMSHVEWMKVESASYLCFALLCAACAWRYLHDQALPEPQRITIGQIQAYLANFIALQAPIATLLQVGTLKSSAQVGLNRINAVLTTASTTPDPIAYEAEVPLKGDIQFFNVHFSYDAGNPVLRDISLTIPYGQKVALVGPSGAGKSTMAQLLLRLYDPDQGAILIGGLNIRHCTGHDLRRHFAVVPQDPFIFRTTIRQNLCVALAGATDGQLERACRQANAWEFITALAKGLDTPVGESGATLSGGQKQRLAIARALLLDPAYFIFDEATSALDTV